MLRTHRVWFIHKGLKCHKSQNLKERNFTFLANIHKILKYLISVLRTQFRTNMFVDFVLIFDFSISLIFVILGEVREGQGGAFLSLYSYSSSYYQYFSANIFNIYRYFVLAIFDGEFQVLFLHCIHTAPVTPPLCSIVMLHRNFFLVHLLFF